MKKLIALILTVVLLCASCISVGFAADYSIYATKKSVGYDSQVISKNDDEQRFYVTVTWMEFAQYDTVYFGSRFVDQYGNVTDKITSDGLPYSLNRDEAQSCPYFSSAGAKKGSRMKLQMKLHQDNSHDNAFSRGRWNP